MTDLALDPAAADLLFRDARTPNAFTDEPVTAEDLECVYDLVKWGPTSMNQQPLRVVVVPAGERRDKLVSMLMGGNQAKTVAAPMTVIFAADVDFHQNMAVQFPSLPTAEAMFEGFGREGRQAPATMNAAMQMAYWVVGLRAAGLAIGPMTGANFDAINAEFFPDGRHVALCVANIGHPDPSSYYPRGPRLAFDDVVATA